jgi:seryl-tRNA synthetase
MDANANNWLTLAEIVRQSNFNDIEARRLIKRFGKFLGSRNFGDIVKYPPAAAEAVILIGELYRQGCTTEEITTIMSQQHHLPGSRDQLQREVGVLVKLQNQVGQLLRSTCEVVQNLIWEVEVLTAKLEAAEAEIQNLKEEKHTHRAGTEERNPRELN